jgi:hypothetical protein
MTSASNQDIPRKVAASQGFHWVVEGFRLYRKNLLLLLSAAFGHAVRRGDSAWPDSGDGQPRCPNWLRH